MPTTYTGPGQLEAWILAEHVAAGIAGASEYFDGVLVDEPAEVKLALRLAAAATGVSFEQFSNLDYSNHRLRDG